MTENRFITLLAAGAALLLASLAPAQDAPKPADPAPQTDPEKTGEPKKDAPVPSLDELLGLPEAGAKDETAKPAEDITQKRLDEQLDQEPNIADEFQVALKEMRETADRLEYSLDTGTVTQRLQASVIRRLEELIEASQQQQSSSSSSSQSQQQQPNQPQQQQSQANNPSGSNTQERLPPGGSEGELRDTLDTARAAWGALPERVRDALQQGSGDYFSRLYESLTESYYKRLAEEGSENR